MSIFVIIGIIVLIVTLAFSSVMFINKKLHGEITQIAKALMILLVIQFLLGILTNLYTFSWYISLHIIIAVIILTFAINFRIKTFRDENDKVIGLYGVLGVSIAFVSGVVFMITSNNIFSFTMAIGFIIALIAYTKRSFTQVTTSKTKPKQKKASTKKK